MFFIAIGICVVAALIIALLVPKRVNYTRLDKVGLVFNIVLSVVYIPLSLFGVFSIFMADAIHMYSETVQAIISILISIGLALPFVSVASVVLSVVFRKKGKSLLGFLIQFVPLILFLILVIAFEFIGNISEVTL